MGTGGGLGLTKTSVCFGFVFSFLFKLLFTQWLTDHT